MSSNEWVNTDQRNIRFVNKCSQDIYVGSKMPSDENVDDSICTINNYDNLNNLPYSTISEGDQNNPQPCKDFSQIIAKIDGTESAGADGGVQDYPLRLFNKDGGNKCNTRDDWCRAAFQVFPMVLNEEMSRDEILNTFLDASLHQGISEFTFGADPNGENKANDDNYDISAIIRGADAACSAHSNRYENDFGMANTEELCKTRPTSEEGTAWAFNEEVVYHTLDLSQQLPLGESSKEKGCNANKKTQCFGADTTSYYGCGMPQTYTYNGRTYIPKLKENLQDTNPGWHLDIRENDTDTPLTDKDLEKTIFDDIRRNIWLCSYTQVKQGSDNAETTLQAIEKFIPWRVRAFDSDGNLLERNESCDKPELLCNNPDRGDPGSMIRTCNFGYMYQYDDHFAGTTCRPPLGEDGHSTYEITYCPNGDIPDPDPPDPDPPDPDPPDPPDPDPPDPDPPDPDPDPVGSATCSTLLSCISGMILDPLKGTELCSGDVCDMAIDSDTCCKAIENSASNVPSNSQTEEEESSTSNRASLSNDNTRFVSQIDDRPMYDGSSLDKKTSHTNIMQSSNYNPVGIDEGSGYSFLSNISSTVSGLGTKSNSIGLQPNNFYW